MQLASKPEVSKALRMLYGKCIVQIDESVNSRHAITLHTSATEQALKIFDPSMNATYLLNSIHTRSVDEMRMIEMCFAAFEVGMLAEV